MSLNERLKQFRESKSLTAKDFASSIGLDPSQYARIEKGSANLTTDKLKDLSSIYGLSINWLVAGTGPMMIDGSFTTEPNKRKGNLEFEISSDLLSTTPQDEGALGTLKYFFTTIMGGMSLNKDSKKLIDRLLNRYSEAADYIIKLEEEKKALIKKNEGLEKEIQQLLNNGHKK